MTHKSFTENVLLNLPTLALELLGPERTENYARAHEGAHSSRVRGTALKNAAEATTVDPKGWRKKDAGNLVTQNFQKSVLIPVSVDSKLIFESDEESLHDKFEDCDSNLASSETTTVIDIDEILGFVDNNFEEELADHQLLGKCLKSNIN